MIHYWIGNGTVSGCVNGVTKVSAIYELERWYDVRDVCSMRYILGTGVYLADG